MHYTYSTVPSTTAERKDSQQRHALNARVYLNVGKIVDYSTKWMLFVYLFYNSLSYAIDIGYTHSDSYATLIINNIYKINSMLNMKFLLTAAA